MAVNAANFYTTHLNTPSIFEVIAQKNLQSLLNPAVEKIVHFLSEQYPNHFSWAQRHYDEMFLAVNGLLQYHYLKTHGASFAENFYSLKRLRLEDDYEMNGFQIGFSWCSIVLLPYVCKKFNKKLEEILLELPILPNSREKDAKKLLVQTASCGKLFWGVWTLVNYIRYMSAKSQSQSPILQLLNLKLVYCNEEPNEFMWKLLFSGKMSFEEIISLLLKNSVWTLLEISAFLVQFLQVWNNEKVHFKLSNLPVVPAPQMDPKCNQYRGKCAICLQTWRTPTVLPISGYIFCFSCIFKHLKKEEKCPVTNLPAKPLDLVRIYK